ncbi:uncharacterized protein [Spinacia oleracea]|uniref:Ubiquitin-like domain-containing protein n=1 Tax=Spinacia oleracea TaxID=3562 RepID=A0A9R0J321_SPIOL|nr:uncharacterized protein LOC110799119 [Spinacia oleracea]XP_056690923.1 uncharacterized protein LOC110799119 [Spinacia oleracea]
MANSGDDSDPAVDAGDTKLPPPPPKNDAKYMFLKFVNQKDEATYLKVLRKAPISKAFEKYYHSNHIQFGINRFLFQGNRIHPNCSQTPIDLGIQDRDQIDVTGEVNGGAPLN